MISELMSIRFKIDVCPLPIRGWAHYIPDEFRLVYWPTRLHSLGYFELTYTNLVLNLNSEFVFTGLSARIDIDEWNISSLQQPSTSVTGMLRIEGVDHESLEVGYEWLDIKETFYFDRDSNTVRIVIYEGMPCKYTVIAENIIVGVYNDELCDIYITNLKIANW